MTPSPVKYAALLLTHRCNLRCRYCYAGKRNQSTMSWETAQQAVEFLHAQSPERCTITFFGGEPMLEFALLREIVTHSRKRYGSSIQFRMSTNGTLLDQEALDFFRANEMYFTLSLDGSARQHDRQRRFCNGGGSYQAIETIIAATLAFNPYTMAVSVVVPDTVGEVAAGVESLFDRGFRYVLQTLDYSAPWTKKHLGVLRKQYRTLVDSYERHLQAGHKIYYSPFDERIKTWAQKPYGRGDLCDIANTQLAISPAGRFYPCVQFVGDDSETDQQHTFGDVFTGFDEARRLSYIEQNYADRQSCVGCALDGRCANYCGCINWRATGRIDQIPPIICEHERLLIPLVDRMANRLWADGNRLFRRKFYDPSFPVSSYLEDCLASQQVASV